MVAATPRMAAAARAGARLRDRYRPRRRRPDPARAGVCRLDPGRRGTSDDPLIGAVAMVVVVIVLTYLGVEPAEGVAAPRSAVRPSPYPRSSDGERDLDDRSVSSRASCGRLADELGVSRPLASVLVRRGLRRPGRGAGVPRGRAARARPVRARRHARGGRDDPRRGRRRASGSASTATTTPTASARPRSPSSCCASSAPTPCGICRRGSRRATGSRADDRQARRRRASTSSSPSTAASPPSPRSTRRSALGLEVVVTDHHRPGDTLPDCPVVAPLKGDYPFAGLCGTAVVWKLAEALLGAGHPFLERHLDVVALATVADVVPLVDESRALALAGLRRLAQTQKPGLRALMRVAGRRPGRVRRGRDRLPARAAHQRRRPARPARGRARAAAHRRRRRGRRGSPSSSRS